MGCEAILWLREPLRVAFPNGPRPYRACQERRIIGSNYDEMSSAPVGLRDLASYGGQPSWILEDPARCLENPGDRKAMTAVHSGPALHGLKPDLEVDRCADAEIERCCC